MTQLQTLDPGKSFEYAGRAWILLDRHEDRHLCITAEPVTAMQFDKGLNSRFEKASVNNWLNGQWFYELLQAGGKEIDFNSILMNISFSMTIGDCVRGLHAGLLSWHQWLRYDALIPRACHWQWTCTISEGIRGNGLRCIAGKPQTYGYYPPNDPTPMVRPAVSLAGWTEVGVRDQG